MDLTQGLMIVNVITKNTIKQATLYKHNKTGNWYVLLNDHLIECTNGREEKEYCLYASMKEPNKVFVREREEFFQKFTKMDV